VGYLIWRLFVNLGVIRVQGVETARVPHVRGFAPSRRPHSAGATE
jgi:hypothetical protein